MRSGVGWCLGLTGRSLRARGASQAAICAALFSALRVSNEVEKQYGRGLAWETSGIWLRRFFGVYFFPLLGLQFVVWALASDAHEKLMELSRPSAAKNACGGRALV